MVAASSIDYSVCTASRFVHFIQIFYKNCLEVFFFHFQNISMMIRCLQVKRDTWNRLTRSNWFVQLFCTMRIRWSKQSKSVWANRFYEMARRVCDQCGQGWIRPKMTEEVIFNQTYPQHTNIVTFVLIYNYEISQTGIWVKCWKILEKLKLRWVFFFF